MKKIVLLMFFLLVAVLTTSCQKQNFEIEGNVLVSCYGSAKEIVVPEGVTEIATKAFVDLKAEVIILPEGVEKINQNAFYGCEKLNNVIIPDSVHSINMPFYGCNNVVYNEYKDCLYLGNDTNKYVALMKVKSGVDNLYISSNTKVIDTSAFWDIENNSIENLYYDGTIAQWCEFDFGFSNSPMQYANNFCMLDENDNYYNVSNIDIPSEVTKLGMFQFYEFKNIQNITMSDNVVTIGEYAFANCYNLETLNFSKNLKEIKEYAFNNCWALKEITLNDQLTTIESCAFDNCGAYYMYIPKSVSTIEGSVVGYYNECVVIYCESTGKENNWDENFNNGRKVYWGIKKEDVVKQDDFYYILDNTNNVAKITRYAGESENVIVPGEITINGKDYVVNQIGEQAFASNFKIINIDISENITIIGKYAFKKCDNLQNVKLPMSLKEIEEGAFLGCNFSEIVIPENVNYIGACIFDYCDWLATIYCVIDNQPESWDENWNYESFWGKYKNVVWDYNE